MRPGKGAEVRSMHQVGLSVYSTVVVTRGCGELRAFSYSQGADIPGVFRNRVPASRRETNMNVSYQLVDEETTWIGFGWSVAAVTPAALTPSGVAYRVTQEDVADFLQAGFLRLFIGSWDNAFLELVPDQHAVQRDEAGWRQRVPLAGPLHARRLEKFWGELSWPRTQPTLSTPDSALAVTFRLSTEAEGVEFIGKYEDLTKNPKEKLYVAVGKAGLEQLLEDLMWWPPNEDK